MPRKLYVTNLNPEVARDELRRLFGAHGAIRSVAVIHQFGNAPRASTAFVEMDSDRHGAAAIAALNGTFHRGSALAVAWAVPTPRQGLDVSPMFEPMNTPGHDVIPVRPGPWRDGFQNQCWRSGGRQPA